MRFVTCSSNAFRLSVLAIVLVALALSSSLHAQATSAPVAFGSVNVGSSTTSTVTFTFTASTTVTAVYVLSQGATNGDFQRNSAAPGTCAATSYSNTICTVGVTFTAGAPGTRVGAVELATSAGPSAGGIAMLNGTGMGGQLTLLPGTQSTVTGTSNFNTAFELASDQAGNIYATSYGNGYLYKETLSGNVATQTTIASVSDASGIAVNGAGDVFVVSSYYVYEYPWLPATSTYGSALTFNCDANCWSVALDPVGNLFVGEASRIYESLLTNGSYGTFIQILNGYNNIHGLAVDSADNLYIADLSSVSVEKLSGGAYTKTVLNSGLTNANGIALDAAGDIYVSDNQYNYLLRYVPNGSGGYTSTTIGTVAPNGVTVTPADQLYFTDGNTTLYRIDLTTVSSYTSSTQSYASPETAVTVLNTGNAALKFTAASAVAPFSIGADNACTTSATVASLGTCALTYQFTPTTSATPQTGTLTLTSNGGTGTVDLSGTLSSGTATKLGFYTPPATGVVAGGNAGVVKVVAQDANNDYVTKTSTSITLAITYPSGSSPATQMSTVNVANGVATFNDPSITLTKSGTSTYAASSASLTPASTTATIIPGPATQMTVTPASSPAYLFIPDNVTVTEFDAYGNQSTSGDEVLMLPNGPATIPPSFHLVNGTYTAPITFQVTGDFSVETQDVTVKTCCLFSNIDVTVNSPSTTSNLSFGNVNVGSSATSVVTFTFAAPSTTVSKIYVLSQGSTTGEFQRSSTPGSCTNTTYAVGAQCTVSVTFTPSQPGVRVGAVELATTNGPSVGGIATINGNGVGPQITLPPGTQTTITGHTAFSNSIGMASDQAGNVYVSDYNTGTLYKETISGSTATESIIDINLDNPAGIAVDGAGDVFVASIGDANVYEYPWEPAISSYGSQIIATICNVCSTVALDPAGNLFVGDGNQVDKIVPVYGNYTYNGNDTVPVSGYNNVLGLAVDAADNLYIADQSTVSVQRLSGGVYAKTTIASGLNNTNGVAIDAAGDVYVSDPEFNYLLRYAPDGSGGYTHTTIGNLPSSGVTLTGSGQLYINNSAAVLARVDLTTANSSASSTQGYTSPEVAVSAINTGNALLTITSDTTAAPFAIGPSNTCTPGATVLSLATCALTYQFTPTTSTTPQTGSLALLTNGDTGNLNLTGIVSGSATQLAFHTAPATGVAAGGNAGVVKIAVMDASGNAVSSPISVTLTITYPDSSIQTYTAAAANGIVAFNTPTLTKPGTYTYAATSTGLTPASTTATVIAGPATHLAVTPSSTSLYAATPDNMVVTALDAYGNQAASTDTIHLSANPVTATLPANFALVSGSSTQPVTFTTAGNYTVTTTDITNSSIASANTATIAVLTPNYIWLVNTTGTVSELNNTGTPLLSSAVGTAATASTLGGVAVDSTGNVWSVTNKNNTLDFVNKSGTGATTYSSNGLNAPSSVAVDGNSNIWVANSGNATISLFTDAGAPPVTPSTIYKDTAVSNTAAPSGIAIDISGNVWVSNQTGNSVTQIIGAAAPAAPLSTAVGDGTSATKP